MRIQIILSLGLVLFFLGCSQEIQSKKVVRDGIEMLHGKISPEQLYYDYPEWKNIENEYLPEQQVIDKLRQTDRDIRVDIFMGTWCGDSRREVPHFYRILKEAGLDKKFTVNLYAVDRKKQVEGDLAEKNRIERVATFIFFEDGVELGRIVETPQMRLEEDILTILEL